MTLREKLKSAEQICRDLADHLERGFAPKAKSLKELLRTSEGIPGPADVTDRTVYNTVEAVLESDRFSVTVVAKLQAMIEGIDTSVGQIVAE